MKKAEKVKATALRRPSPKREGPGEAHGALPPSLKFTFIIPAYADKPHGMMEICGAIDSVRAQTDDAWEILLVHDGPNEIIRALAFDVREELPKDRKDRIQYFEAPFRGLRGGHASIEQVKDKARGEFICVLNGDNIVRPEYVEKMWHPNADIVTCWVLMNDLPGIILSGRGWVRGRMDRLCYAIRTGIAKRVPHGMHLDADYDWIINSWEFANKSGPARVVHVDALLGEHN